MRNRICPICGIGQLGRWKQFCSKCLDKRKEVLKEKNRVRSADYRKKYPEKVKETQRKADDKRKHPRKRNPNSTYNQIAANKRYIERNPEKVKKYRRDRSALSLKTLDDNYMKYLLTRRNNLSAKDIPQSLVEAKRAEILMKRFIKELNNG